MANVQLLVALFALFPLVWSALYPFPQHVQLATGTILPSHDRSTMDADVRTFYAGWKSNYVRQMGTTNTPVPYPRYRILNSKNNNQAATVSEGQGYGMLITAIMAEGNDTEEHTIFDGLWYFVLAHPSNEGTGLADWYVDANESSDGEDDDSAFDGDMDMAYALLLAHRQWGSSGNINYLSEALRVISAIGTSTIGPDSYLPLLGDWVEPNAGTPPNQYSTRTSDFAYGHFRTYAEFQQPAFWGQVVISSTQTLITSLQHNFANVTGLVPDFVISVDGGDEYAPPTGTFLEGDYDGDYYYNAARVPWRIGTDAVLNGDITSKAQVNRITEWVEASTGGDPSLVRPGYFLNGTPISTDYWSTLFTSPLGVAAMCSNKQAWLDAIYDSVKGVSEDYFEDSVTLLSMLVMTGNFWDPASVSSSDGGTDVNVESGASSESGTGSLSSWIKRL